MLLLEATIGFNKRDDEDESEGGEMDPQPVHQETAGKIRLTSQDQKFLRALKISIEEDAK